jgi:class 3 adenylate cyclase/Flp pilus assembly protein TadD
MESAPQVASTPITLVFTDMVGSSAAKRAESLGEDSSARDRAYLEGIQTKYLRLIRTTLAEHNGKEIMTIGDSFFLTFDDSRDALLYCCEVQMRLKSSPIMTASGPLKLRIGIHVGKPEFFENSWHGTDVDIAARSESAGSAEQIVLTEAARRDLGELPGIQLRPLGTFALKGVGHVKLWDVDYDEHGLRKPQILSLEQIRRNGLLKLARQAGYGVLAAGLVAAAYFFYQHRQRNTITEKDKLILADFENKTGDPVFDVTLRQALSIQLAQSPFLQLVGDDEMHADLRYLSQSTDQRITPALAREIGQREGMKAYIAASIANLGSTYVVSANAVNCATGEPIASTQAEAQDKNHVLQAVSAVAVDLRTKLGESLASVKKLNTPFEGDVTTASLEAFHAYALGDEAHVKDNNNSQALEFYKRAVELDPNFAMAYARTGVMYLNLGRTPEAMEQFSKAYALRERVTERERLYIEGEYAQGRGDVPATLRAWQSLLEDYPKDTDALVDTGFAYTQIGDIEKSVFYTKQDVEIEPADSVGLSNLAAALLAIGNPAEAKKYMDGMAAASAANESFKLAVHAQYAFENGDNSWKSDALAAASLPNAYQVEAAVSGLYYMQGSLSAGRAAAERGAENARAGKAPDAAGNILATAALFEAQYGECAQVPALAQQALATDRSIVTLPGAALALAFCGQGKAQLPALHKLVDQWPDNTVLNAMFVPAVNAAIALHENQAAEVSSLVEEARPYPMVSTAPILEAEAQLALHHPAETQQALQPVLKYRYNEFLSAGQSPSYGMAQLLTARAQAMAGDKAAATASYQKAMEVWKNADAGFKPLADAKQELAALQGK